MTIIIPAGLTKVSTMADGTLRLQFDCQEIKSEDMANLFSQRNNVGYLMFKGEQFVEHDIEFLRSLKVDNVEGIKSRSQRLRAVLYRVWEFEKVTKTGTPEFETFYAVQMEKIINQFKSILP